MGQSILAPLAFFWKRREVFNGKTRPIQINADCSNLLVASGLSTVTHLVRVEGKHFLYIVRFSIAEDLLRSHQVTTQCPLFICLFIYLFCSSLSLAGWRGEHPLTSSFRRLIHVTFFGRNSSYLFTRESDMQQSHPTRVCVVSFPHYLRVFLHLLCV